MGRVAALLDSVLIVYYNLFYHGVDGQADSDGEKSMLNNTNRNTKLAQLSPIGWALLYWGLFLFVGLYVPW
jgi:hypothetical protein